MKFANYMKMILQNKFIIVKNVRCVEEYFYKKLYRVTKKKIFIVIVSSRAGRIISRANHFGSDVTISQGGVGNQAGNELWDCVRASVEQIQER